MLYNLNGKNIKIPDAEIERSMRTFNISKDESIQLWLEDNDYLTNEIVEELSAKAKVNKIKHEATSDKPRKDVKKERKPDQEKEEIIKMLADCLKNAGIASKITNVSKIVEFDLNGNHYKIDLIRQRSKK